MKKEDFSITTSTVQSYKIRHKEGCYWADINIDNQEKGGRIQIASDYGDWQNYWPVPGSDFKRFLIKLNMDYFAGKVGANKWFDHDKTIKAYKVPVLESRRGDGIRADRAREIFDEINELEDSPYRDEFMIALNGKTALMDFFDWMPDICYGINPSFKMFWDYIWPIFTAALNAELENAPLI